MISIRRAWWAALVLVAFVGCDAGISTPVETTAPDSPAVPAPSPTVSTPASDAPKAETAAVSLSDKEVAAIKLLPADEQTLAMKQVVCPVSDGKLGAMGKPFKVTAKGQTIFLCCDGCVGDVESDPEAVLAKLKK